MDALHKCLLKILDHKYSTSIYYSNIDPWLYVYTLQCSHMTLQCYLRHTASTRAPPTITPVTQPSRNATEPGVRGKERERGMERERERERDKRRWEEGRRGSEKGKGGRDNEGSGEV